MLTVDSESSWVVRSLPSSLAVEVDIIFDIMIGLVRLNQCFYLLSIQVQFLLLKCRCGVDGFMCLMRNNYAFDLALSSF